MQIGTANTSVVSKFFTRLHLGFTTDQKSFNELRAQNPAPLSKEAQRLAEIRGLQDPLTTNNPGKIDAYA